MKLAACLLNISEARRGAVVAGVVGAAVATIEAGGHGAAVLNTFVDTEYNRSVITVCGQLPALEDAVVSACEAAASMIDLRRHEGGHPRLGGVDLVPLHPVTPGTSLADCEAAAATIAARLVAAVPGWSCFTFGPGAGRGLAERRREVGWFKSEVAPGVGPDLGTFHPARGMAGVGAAPYMSNFNISLATADPGLARRVLAAVRESSGGLPGVAAMAFPRQHGSTEVACNVDMFRYDAAVHATHLHQGNIEHIFGDFWRTSFSALEDRVAALAAEAGVSVLGDSVVIGFTPATAAALATRAMERREASLVTEIDENMHM